VSFLCCESLIAYSGAHYAHQDKAEIKRDRHGDENDRRTADGLLSVGGALGHSAAPFGS
jgi:hypothetical protein